MSDFTEKFIEDLQPDATRYDVYERDDFLISVMPNGLKTWVYLQSVKGQQRQTLGVYPDMTLQEARIAWAEVTQTSGNMDSPSGGSLEKSTSDTANLSKASKEQTLSDIETSKVSKFRRVLVVASAFAAVGLGGIFIGDRIEYSELLEPWSEQSIIKRASVDDRTSSIPYPLAAANPPSPTPAGVRLSERTSRADLVALATHDNRSSDASAEEVPLTPFQGLIPQVARAQFTNGVEDREPIDELGPTIGMQGEDVRQLYFFTDIRGMNGQTVTHRWQHEGQVVAEVTFDIRGERWRVFSSKNLLPNKTGHWEVVVVDSSDTPMHMSSFLYQNSEGDIPESAHTFARTVQPRDTSILANSLGSAEKLNP